MGFWGGRNPGKWHLCYAKQKTKKVYLLRTDLPNSLVISRLYPLTMSLLLIGPDPPFISSNPPNGDACVCVSEGSRFAPLRQNEQEYQFFSFFFILHTYSNRWVFEKPSFLLKRLRWSTARREARSRVGLWGNLQTRLRPSPSSTQEI